MILGDTMFNFLNETIENAYYDSDSAYAQPDARLQKATEQQSELFSALYASFTPRQREQFNALMSSVADETEILCQFAFQQGWLAREKRSKKEGNP